MSPYLHPDDVLAALDRALDRARASDGWEDDPGLEAWHQRALARQLLEAEQLPDPYPQRRQGLDPVATPDPLPTHRPGAAASRAADPHDAVHHSPETVRRRCRRRCR